MVMIRFDMRELEKEVGDAAAEIALEVSTELINQLQIEAPVGATGRLSESFQIFRDERGVVWLGTRVPYAKGVWRGKPPHTPDFDDIKVWARRKLGDESAAGPVYRKIQQEGTNPDDYLGRAIDNTLDRVGQLRLSEL